MGSAGRITTVYTQVANLLRGIRELTVANGRSAALSCSVEVARTEMATVQRKVLILNEVPRLVLDLVLYGGILAALVWALSASNPTEVLPLVALYVVAGMRIVPGVARVLGAMTQVRTAAWRSASFSTVSSTNLGAAPPPRSCPSRFLGATSTSKA